MTKVRGKFIVSTVTRNHYQPGHAAITLDAIYSANPEDQSYATTTPSAQITMYVSNPAAVAKLALGRSFYVDFIEAE